MLHEGRIEIEGMGPFSVCFRSESCEPWMTDKIGFFEAAETIEFLIDSLNIPPQKACKAVVEAMDRGRSACEKVVCSHEDLRRIFNLTLRVASTRRAS